MVSREEERNGSVYTESNSSDEEGYDENDSDYTPSNKRAKISTNNYYTGGKGKSLSPLCLDKQFQHGKNTSKRGQTPKCATRNALLARENRIKKKLYIERLEGKLAKYSLDNKQLNRVIENQSGLIGNLKKEVKYLKSILANGSDISRILKGIQQSTGMSVTTSLNKNLTIKTEENLENSLKTIESTDEHPWLDDNFTENDFLTSDYFENEEYSPLLLEENIFSGENIFPPEINHEIEVEQLGDHNYTARYNLGEDLSDGNVGVCLHIANHKVSLEFCSECSQRATDTWDEVDGSQE